MNPSLSSAHAAALAAHRFGLGEPSLKPLGNDPRGWLVAQIGPASAQRGQGLSSGADGAKRFAAYFAKAGFAQTASGAQADSPGMGQTTMRSTEQQFAEHFRQTVQDDVRARLVTATTSDQPFNERLALFWANHFTVSTAKGSARGMAGSFEREAIRPHIGGSFESLLQASVRHPGMLMYLDNQRSAGPQSAIVQRLARRPRKPEQAARRVGGLNENLAREVLELHTLGASSGSGSGAYGGWGGFSQTDVTEFARVLTGWRVSHAAVIKGDSSSTEFDPDWHEPGPKTVLGKRYAEGPEALRQVLADLARHPSTARFVCTRLARHFVADEPPPALVARLERAWRSSDGNLPAVARALVDSPEAWQPQAVKLKSPEEFLISTVRLLGLGERAFERAPDAGLITLGQRVQAAPSPAGWPDRAEEWLGPDAVWKRVEWATRVAERSSSQLDARALAQASLGPLLGDETARQIERAADGRQALALLLLSPEFQRR